MSRLSSGFAVFPGIAFALGTWQVYRWDWKQKQLAYREERRVAPVQDFSSEIDADAMDFKRVRATGRFDHSLEVRSGPRSFEGSSGFFVLTPLVLESGKRVVVNRGWVPREDDQSIVRPQGQIELIGVVRKGEKQALFIPDNDGKTFFWLDQTALNAACQADFPVRLDAVRSKDPKSEPPIGGQTVYWMPNNHATYIAT